jgi:hypothetical protein
MVGGAILLSKQDDNGQQKWVTGVTADGVSASVVTAGVLNTGEISIMNNDKSTFRWNSVGLTAFKTKESGTNDGESVLDKTFLDTFVRFD